VVAVYSVEMAVVLIVDMVSVLHTHVTAGISVLVVVLMDWLASGA
jgi:hypothetical protein